MSYVTSLILTFGCFNDHPMPLSITPSVSSARSLLSPSSISEQDQRAHGVPPSFSKSLSSTKLPNEGLNLNPDELFTKYTVSEVRAVQHRLRSVLFPHFVTCDDLFYAHRTDADAKQEELRLMVGCAFLVMRDCGTILNEAESAENDIVIYCRPLLLLFLLPNHRGTYAKLWKNVKTQLSLKMIYLCHQ